MTIFRFPGGSDATLAQVGGKGLSLIKSSNAGLAVPPGFVLAVDFFQPWLEALKTTSAWSAFARAGADEMAAACAALKKASDDFAFDEMQVSAIETELKDFASNFLQCDPLHLKKILKGLLSREVTRQFSASIKQTWKEPFFALSPHAWIFV
jgi:phosphoenolpyruvate synthase/pyruvate phosphate dikinase